MSILDFLFHHTHTDGSQFGTGELARPEHFLAPDSPQHSEIAGSFQPAQWAEKALNAFITYPNRNQTAKSDCTCYALAKALSIDELQENGNWRELSPDSVYPYVVKPGGGASSLDAMNFSVSKGMTLEALYQSDGLTEAEAEDPSKIGTDAKIVGMVYKPGSIVQSASDIETIASILQGYRMQGIKKGVMATVVGQNNGTWLSPFPTPPNSQNGLWYHRILITDYGLIQGQKKLAFDNSWGTAAGQGGQQFLGKEYEPYLYGAAYTLNIPDAGSQAQTVPPPAYTWSSDLSVGSSGPDVLALQQALQSLGMFPIATVVKPTGYFGGITKAGVILFQESFGLPQTGVADAATREKLNGIF